MKKKFSLLACILASAVLFTYRVSYFKLDTPKPFVCTTWDALGYYFYLPSTFIYKDVSELKWFPKIDSVYSVSGGKFYQADKSDNGNYVFNYFGGVALLQSPFFLLGHLSAKIFGYKQDGFSPPYQYAIAIAAVVYCILAMFLLRKVLLRFFDDATVAVTLLLLLLASNFIQYVSVDGAMSHSFIFPLYVLVIYCTIKWHEKPKIFWACVTGFTIGLATICRPTEIIIFFIPLLWNTHKNEMSKAKWKLVRENKLHVVYVAIAGFIGVLPQLLYWKITSGSFIYDVGSKWVFLNPFFRVLFGWEKGWFIYTPVAILFVAGLFFVKKFPFKNSVITFSMLNIWIIISWYDWRYGASYSCRALVQSYPVFALALGALIQKINFTRWKYFLYGAGGYLIFVNLFQIVQYNKTILHYNDMNRKYYEGIYLNFHPSPLDMSLLDTDERLYDETNYQKKLLAQVDSVHSISFPEYSSAILFQIKLDSASEKTNNSDAWLKVESSIRIEKGTWGGFLVSELQAGDSVKQNKIRLLNAISPFGENNEYTFYVRVPEYFNRASFKLSLSSQPEFLGKVSRLKVLYLTGGRKKLKPVTNSEL
ncbi:MAG: glycosyltransferase family 39 protein [Bacteroidetes bacterium]|nr:glycosyltransferase family 39 protein [Bacteroidota bacterium]